MAPPGRKPKAAALDNLEGNPGKRGRRTAAAVPAGRLVMPRELLPDAQAEWRRVVPALVAMGVVTHLDRTALADYCRCVARLHELEACLAIRGTLVEGERGLVKNPAAQLAREYRAALQRWCAEFGLTPSSRSRMALPEPPDDNDPFADLVG